VSTAPRVSIGIPVYCGENYLAQLLECMVGQTFRDIEIIISDNASTDRTRQICEEFARRDSRVRYFRNPVNIGAAPNYNRVFALARGEYFKWTAHDDLYDRTYIARCVEALDRDPDVMVAHSEMTMVGPAGNPLYFDAATGRFVDATLGAPLPSEPREIATSGSAVERFYDILFRMYWCTVIFGLMRTDVVRTTSLHRSYYGSDKVLLSELALMGRFHYVPEPLFAKRQHLQTSHFRFKTLRERAEWIDPTCTNPSALGPLFKGYWRAARHDGSLDSYERAACLAMVFAKAAYAMTRRLGHSISGHPHLSSSRQHTPQAR
jgi:glycosyltransferase involved in cell wall biosynthesis